MIPAVLFAIVAVLDQIRPVAAWNDSFSVWLQGPQEPALTVVGFFTDWLFSAQLVLGLAALLCVVLAFRRRWLLAASAALVFPVVLLEAVLKFLVHQPPASTFLQVRVLFRSSDVNLEALAHGFPSGHAARIGFVLGWLLLLLVPRSCRPQVTLGTLLLTLLIAWTRIYVGDHSLLEIVAGLLLAAAFLPLAGALMSIGKRQPGRW
ncbi:MAG: phosphatase PAP2 family protein, partial [Chloroflexota bacterium]